MADFPAFSNLRVLLVDDDQAVRKAVSSVLQRLGCSVTACEDGPEALEQAGSRPPDLVLLDLDMPGMTGRACLKALKELVPGTPVIICSGSAQLDEFPQADGALQKPFSLTELAEKMAEVLTPE